MYQFVTDKKSGQLRKGPLLVFATMILLIFITVLALDRKNTAELTKITQSSIKAQLIAVAQSASTLIDLGNFKQVNDSAGHDAGDELLRKNAEFLQQQSSTFMENMKGKAVTFRPTAGLLNVSARVGGDEFIQVFPGAATAEDAARIAEYLLENFKTNEISGYVAHYQVTLSIGIALFPRHAEGHHVLIKYADTAMYHAKKTGKSQYCIYADGLLGKDEEMMLRLSEEAWN